MKTFAILAVAVTLAVICVANSASAQPLEEAVENVAVNAVAAAVDTVPKEEALPAVEEHSRHKRATCDLLSKFNVNHSACAAHCLLKRYKGGYCNSKQVCVCRR